MPEPHLLQQLLWLQQKQKADTRLRHSYVIWNRSEGKARPVYVETYERSVSVAPARSRGVPKGAKSTCAAGRRGCTTWPEQTRSRSCMLPHLRVYFLHDGVL